MNEITVKSKDFLDKLFGGKAQPNYSKYLNKVIRIAEEFMNGENINNLLLKYDISFSRLQYILSNEPIIAELFRDAKISNDNKLKITHEANISNIALENRDWRASAWLLERKFPDEYGKQEKPIDADKVKHPALFVEKIQTIINNYSLEDKDNNVIEERKTE